MSASAVFAPARTPAAAGPWLAAAALFALALAIQLRFGMIADVAWLVDCDEKWLAGAVPYRDFVEINPPASLLLYLGPVAAARALGIASETAVSVFGFGLAGLALALSAAILPRRPPASVALAAVLALVVLPGETFCERDHLAAVLGLPFLAATLARAEGRAVPLGLALAAGVGAGAMAAIKPPYAIIGVLLALYLVSRVGWRTLPKAPEYFAAAAVGLVYVACVGPLFPDYVARVLPLGVAIYVPSRESLLALLVSPGATLVLALAATAFLSARGREISPGFVVAGLAAAGAALGYIVQGKGWVYQAIPAAMFATLAGGFALERQGRRAAALAAGALAAGVVTPTLHNFGLGWALGLAVALGADYLRTRAFARDLGGVAPLAFAAAVGAACGVCTIERPPTPELERQLAALGPGLTLASVSEDMGLAFPLTRRIGATWVAREHSLFVASDAARVLSRRPDDALRAKLAPFVAAERDALVADVAAHKPDALLVGPLRTALHAQIWADPEIAAMMAGYRRVAAETRPGYAAELWLRKDFAR